MSTEYMLHVIAAIPEIETLGLKKQSAEATQAISGIVFAVTNALQANADIPGSPNRVSVDMSTLYPTSIPGVIDVVFGLFEQKGYRLWYRRPEAKPDGTQTPAFLDVEYDYSPRNRL